jgi:NhaP-type Na+/H+ or K+/H+ antiporter
MKDVGEGGGEVVVAEGSKRCPGLARLAGPLMVAKHPLPAAPSRLQRLHRALLCPPHGALASLLTTGLAAATVWGAAYSMLGQVALPGTDTITISVRGGSVFALLALLFTAWPAGWLVERLLRLPPLLGMLLVGILLNNVPGISVARGLDPAWSAAVRSTALAVILLRAGLGLDPAALKKLSGAVVRLACLPCLAETVAVAGTARLLLGLPWLWGFMLGFVLAAVSPAVVVPCLLSLQERGWGREKGIPTLVIAAASIDDVLAISCFTIILGITFNSSSDLAWVVLKGPLEAVAGVGWGLAWGGLAVLLPAQPRPSTALRLVILGGGALLALFGCGRVGLPGSGALAVLVMGFTAGLGWRQQEGWSGDSNPVSRALAAMWTIFQPLLFSFIGTEIRVSSLEPATVGWGALVLVCGLALRLVVSYGAVLGSGLTARERLFVALAWLPKATVQAAIGGLALDKAKEALAERFPGHNCSQILTATIDGGKVVGFTTTDGVAPGSELMDVCSMVGHGETVLTIAVLVILVTAPIGAVAIMAMGPRLLSRQGEEGEEAREA